MYSTDCYSKCWSDSYRHVTEVAYDIGNSGSQSECIVLSVGSDSHKHVTEVTYDMGNSGSRSECIVLSVGNDPPRSCDRGHLSHLKCFMYGTSHFQHSAAPFWRKCRGTLCSPCIMQSNVPKVLIVPDLRALIWE